MYKSCWCRMFTCLTQFSPLCVTSIIIMSFTKLPETGSACPRARRIYNLQTRCLLSWCSAWPPGESQVLCSIGSPLLGSQRPPGHLPPPCNQRNFLIREIISTFLISHLFIDSQKITRYVKLGPAHAYPQQTTLSIYCQTTVQDWSLTTLIPEV